MNYLLHTVGLDRDFVAWESAGAIGWNSNTMRRYLDKFNGGDQIRHGSGSRWALDDDKTECDVDQCLAAKQPTVYFSLLLT